MHFNPFIYGNKSKNIIARNWVTALRKFVIQFVMFSSKNQHIIITAHDKLDYKLSQCCNPIPGDDVFGFVTINEGIKVHKKDCPNAIGMQSNYAYRIMSAKWIDSSQEEFKAIINITGMDVLGL